MQTPPPTPESPCPKRLVHELYVNDCECIWIPRGRKSLAEIFELVMDQDEYLAKKRRRRMSTGKKMNLKK